MFARTDAGISSEYLFYGVDFVVYCEGLEQTGASASADELFWTTVLQAQGVKCKCKSMGSKSNVLPIAEKIRSESISKTIAAMDRDYDDVFCDLILHPNVLYTFGYSWENDVLQTLDIGISAAMFFDTVDLNSVSDRFAAFQSKQASTVSRACMIDIAYVRSAQALFDRQKPMAIISQKPGCEPTINRANLLAGAKRIGRGHRVLPVQLPTEIDAPFLSFYGKGISKLIFHWFVHVSASFSSARKVPYDTFMSIAVRTSNLGYAEHPRDIYYADMCRKIAL